MQKSIKRQLVVYCPPTKDHQSNAWFSRDRHARSPYFRFAARTGAVRGLTSLRAKTRAEEKVEK